MRSRVASDCRTAGTRAAPRRRRQRAARTQPGARARHALTLRMSTLVENCGGNFILANSFFSADLKRPSWSELTPRKPSPMVPACRSPRVTTQGSEEGR